MKLEVLEQTFTIARLEPDAPLPGWGELFSVTRTSDELSVVCSGDVPADVKAERGWHAIKVVGPLDFSLTGILSELATALAEARVSIFAISTYDTDYILVKDLEGAVKALSAHEFVPRP